MRRPRTVLAPVPTVPVDIRRRRGTPVPVTVVAPMPVEFWCITCNTRLDGDDVDMNIQEWGVFRFLCVSCIYPHVVDCTDGCCFRP